MGELDLSLLHSFPGRGQAGLRAGPLLCATRMAAPRARAGCQRPEGRVGSSAGGLQVLLVGARHPAALAPQVAVHGPGKPLLYSQPQFPPLQKRAAGLWGGLKSEVHPGGHRKHAAIIMLAATVSPGHTLGSSPVPSVTSRSPSFSISRSVHLPEKLSFQQNLLSFLIFFF